MRNAEYGVRKGKRPVDSAIRFRLRLLSRFAPSFFGALLFLSGCQGNSTPSLANLPDGVVNISKSRSLSIGPQTALSGNTVYIVWQEHTGGQNMEVFLTRSGDGGATFEAPINVSQSLSFSGNPKIAASGAQVYVVWEEFVADRNDTDIFFRRADDQNGAFTWFPALNEPGKNLSASAPICGQPGNKIGPCPSQEAAVVAFGDNVFVAWGEATDYLISPITAGQTATQFTLINSEIQMVQSFDRGVDFSPSPSVVSGPKPSAICGANAPQTPSLNPSLAAGNGHVYIAWEDCTRPNSKVLFRRLPDPAGSFDPPLGQDPLILSGSIKGSNRPELAAEGNRVYLLWEGFPFPEEANTCPVLGGAAPNSEILLIRSDNQGATFTSADNLPQSNLSNNDCSSNNGKIAVSGNAVHVAWMDNTPGLSGLVYRRADDGGLGFSAPVLLQGSGSAANPSIAASNGTLFAAWEDATLGNLEAVFTKR